MSTAEMSMATNTARALIEARLETVERALFGRISRAERLDIVGEVESRIDELLRERCGLGNEPTREDVLAVLAKLDPPEAYLDFGSGEEFRMPRFERPVRYALSEMVPADERLRKHAFVSGACGIVGLLAALAAPLAFFVAVQTDSTLIFFGGVGFCALTSLVTGTAALIFAGLSRLKSPWAITGLVLGVVTEMLVLIGMLTLMFGDY
ncbi:hypothetical protein GC170_14105 [bacterium]|nr:hypothetical protein [bacterium]